MAVYLTDQDPSVLEQDIVQEVCVGLFGSLPTYSTNCGPSASADHREAQTMDIKSYSSTYYVTSMDYGNIPRPVDTPSLDKFATDLGQRIIASRKERLEGFEDVSLESVGGPSGWGHLHQFTWKRDGEALNRVTEDLKHRTARGVRRW